MSVVRRQGIKNTVYMYAGIVLGILSTLYIQPFFLSKEQIGITRLIISVATILASVSCLGITSVIVKFFPLFHNTERKHNGFFTVALTFPLFGFILCFLLVTLFGKEILHFYGENGAILQQYFWPIMLSTFFICQAFSFSSYCNSINKSSLPTFINEVVNRLGFITCIILFSYGITTENTYVYTLSLIYFIQLVLLFLIINHSGHPHLSFSFFKNNAHLGAIVSYGLISAFIQITGISIKFIDVVFVGKYETLGQVGVYSIAAFIGLVLETPLNAIERIAGPKISRLFAENNTGEIKKIYKLSSKYLMVFCGFFGCVLVVCIEPLLSLLPGDYSSGALVTIIVCIGAFFNSATGVNYSIVTYSNFFKLGALFYFLLLVLTVALNMILIPMYGIIGAGLATAAVSVLHNLLRFALIQQKLKMHPFTIDTLKIILIIAVSVLASYWIQTENKYLVIFLRGLASASVFTVLIVGLRVFSLKEIKQEIQGFKNTFI
ncbi:MAG: lipopolysaccharide biosynthesis protein [Bacteroidia bacterium]